MTWYAAHIVMVVKFKQGQQRRFPAWENVVLVHSSSEDGAITKAETIDLANSEDDESFEWGGKPAVWTFAGVRKVAECALAGGRPASGDEITYSELEFESLAAAKRYAAGRAMSVRHQDQINVLPKRNFTEVVNPRRKRA